MRKIEQEMRDAAFSGRNWRRGNTEVITYGSVAEVYLFGNHIANVEYDLNRVSANLATLADFPTVTTKSRLRALGVNLTQNQSIIYIDDVAVATA